MWDAFGAGDKYMLAVAPLPPPPVTPTASTSGSSVLSNPRPAPPPPVPSKPPGAGIGRAPSLPASQRPAPAPPVTTSHSAGGGLPPTLQAGRVAPLAPKKVPTIDTNTPLSPSASMTATTPTSRRDPTRQPTAPSPATAALQQHSKSGQQQQQQQQTSNSSSGLAAPGQPRKRERKDKGDPNGAGMDIVRRLQGICTDADPTKLYRNLVKIGQG